MKKQVERDFCDWPKCEEESDSGGQCYYCRKDFCWEHVESFRRSITLSTDRSIPIAINWCADCIKSLTPDGLMQFGVIT